MNAASSIASRQSKFIISIRQNIHEAAFLRQNFGNRHYCEAHVKGRKMICSTKKYEVSETRYFDIKFPRISVQRAIFVSTLVQYFFRAAVALDSVLIIFVHLP